MVFRRRVFICTTCNPDYEPHEDERTTSICEDCDDLDLDEFEDERRRKIAERNEY